LNEQYAYLVDGSLRKVENPKKKKIKHLIPTEYKDGNMTYRFLNHNKINNHEIKRALKNFQVIN